MKKIILMLLCFMSVLSISFVEVSAEDEELGPEGQSLYNGFDYEIYNGEVILYGYYGPDKDIVMPDEIDGYPVTKLDWIFDYDEDGVDSITISKYITDDIVTIQDGTWMRTPFTFSSVGEFIVDEENPYLASYNGSLYSKDYTVLYNCPDNQTVLDTHPNLERIIPFSMTESCFETIILHFNLNDPGYNLGGSNFFQYLDTLKNIVIDEDNEKYFSYNGAMYERSDNDIVLLKYPSAREDTSFSIMDGTTQVSDNAFSGADTLKQIVFPESITSIGVNNYFKDDYIWVVHEGSYAHDYAIRYGVEYRLIDEVGLGDVNLDGIVDYSDAVLILRFDSKSYVLDEQQKQYADVTLDGVVNYNDAVQILRKDAGLIEEFKK